MRFVKLAKKNREVNPKSWEKLYKDEIIRRIRAKYSVDDEFAILHYRDEKPEEFKVYDEFTKKVKADVKEEMGI